MPSSGSSSPALASPTKNVASAWPSAAAASKSGTTASGGAPASKASSARSCCFAAASERWRAVNAARLRHALAARPAMRASILPGGPFTECGVGDTAAMLPAVSGDGRPFGTTNCNRQVQYVNFDCCRGFFRGRAKPQASVWRHTSSAFAEILVCKRLELGPATEPTLIVHSMRQLLLIVGLGAAHAFLKGGGGGATCAADGARASTSKPSTTPSACRAPHPVLRLPEPRVVLHGQAGPVLR